MMTNPAASARQFEPSKETPEYRILGRDEVIRPGDEFRGMFFPDSWAPVSLSVGRTPREWAFLNFRRAVGYRMLAAGEVIKAGDELRKSWSGPVWTPVDPICVGERLASLNVGRVRRKVDTRDFDDALKLASWTLAASAPVIPNPEIEAGEGYRRLAVGGRLQKGDEFHCLGTEWRETHRVGVETDPIVNDSAYRRKVSGPVGDGVADDTKAVRRKLPITRAKFSTTTFPMLGRIFRAPGEGYRALKPGERVEHGDEYWDEALLVYRPVPLNVRGGAVSTGFFRRPVSNDPFEARQALLNQKYEENFKTQAALIRELKVKSDKFRGALQDIRNVKHDDACPVARDIYPEAPAPFAEPEPEPLAVGQIAKLRRELAEATKEIGSLTIDVLDRNRMCEQLGRLLQRQKCGCVYKDCPAHGSYVPDDCELYERVLKGETK